MTVLTARLSCIALALTGAVVGAWALLVPASFWSDFPGSGLGWVAAAGPYDEHLVRDVGALYLALGVVLAVLAPVPAASPAPAPVPAGAR